MSKPQIIALKGRAGCGKSTGAKHLQKHGYVRTAFASPLRALLRGLGLNEDELSGHLKEAPCAKLAGQTPRAVMQVLGSAFRALDPEFFVKMHERAMREIDGDVVVDDCRFPNEAAYVRKFGGGVIEIVSPFTPTTPSGGIAGHESERMDFEPDIMVRNDRNDQFYHNLDEALGILSSEYDQAA